MVAWWRERETEAWHYGRKREMRRKRTAREGKGRTAVAIEVREKCWKIGLVGYKENTKWCIFGNKERKNKKAFTMGQTWVYWWEYAFPCH